MKYIVYQASRQGGRRQNEDRIGYVASREEVLLIAADGMGGHARGEIAAQQLVETLLRRFENAGPTGLAEPAQFLRDAINAAHAAINDLALRHGWSEAPRTTAVACLLKPGQATWAHVGDSRLYHCRNGHVLQITRDHTMVQRLVDQGELDPNHAGLHPGRSRLYNCVGGALRPEVEISSSVAVHDGDILLLCTDGFWSALEEAEMLVNLSTFDLQEAIERLMDQAEFRAGEKSDNLSVIALRYGASLDAMDNAGQPSGMTLEGLTTAIDQFSAPRTFVRMSDAEIDEAIAEIQTALRRFEQNTPTRK